MKNTRRQPAVEWPPNFFSLLISHPHPLREFLFVILPPPRSPFPLPSSRLLQGLSTSKKEESNIFDGKIKRFTKARAVFTNDSRNHECKSSSHEGNSSSSIRTKGSIHEGKKAVVFKSTVFMKEKEQNL